MSIFSWFLPKSKSKPEYQAKSSHGTGVSASGLLSAPASARTPVSGGAVVDLKQQRQERREQLYGVVRAAMLRSEVLAANYKFKVLSLDVRGCQFLVMVDMVNDRLEAPQRLAAIESLIATEAAQRHQLLVKAVYWRTNQPPLVAAQLANTQPAAAVAVAAAAVHAGAAAPFGSAPVAPPSSGFEPIAQEEVLAFKKAIAATSARVDTGTTGEVVSTGPRHQANPTGFEDTQVIEHDDTASPLSGTQFGGLD